MGALYRAHARSVYAFIYSKVGNRETAEDLTADVFLKALAHLDLTREEHSIVAWLFRVARNAVNDYWRTGQGAPVIPFEEALLGRGQRAAVETQGGQAALQAHALLDRLPATYRTVLAHRLLEGASVGETAQAMGISASYVKVLQHRALKRAAELHTRATRATTA
jgi:RNA polymerase sigma-70 factor (ECF subfamily)